MSFVGALTNYGLENEGIDKSQEVQQNLQTGQQQQVLRNQQIQAGQMGLDSANQNRDYLNQMRATGANGAQNGGGIHGSFQAMADAAMKAGRPDDAAMLMESDRKFKAAGMPQVVDFLMNDKTAGPKPEVAKIFSQYGMTQGADPNSFIYDGKGTLTYKDPQSGQDVPINIGEVADRLGMINHPKMETLAAGAEGIIRTPGQPDRIIKNEAAGTSKGFSTGTIYKDGKEFTISFDKDKGIATLIDGQTGKPTSDHADLKFDSMGNPYAIIDGVISKVVPGTPGTPGSNSWFGKNTPATPGTPAHLEPISGQAAPAAPGAAPTAPAGETPPAPGAVKSPKDGNWYMKTQQGWQPVLVNGAPTAKNQNDMPKPTAKPAPAKKTMQVADTQDDIPEVTPAPTRAGAKERQSASIEKLRTSQAAAEKERIAKTFRDLAKLPRMSADDIPVIQDALSSGALTPKETDQANRMLERLKPQTAHYKKGGKVKGYGLSA